jgi:hypothetical protein
MGIDTQLKQAIVRQLVAVGCCIPNETHLWAHPRLVDKRPRPSLIFDFLSRLRRVATSRAFGGGQTFTALHWYNVLMRYIRARIEMGVRRFYLVFDAGVPRNKEDEAEERDQTRGPSKFNKEIYPVAYFHPELEAVVTVKKEAGQEAEILREFALQDIMNERRLRSGFIQYFIHMIEREVVLFPSDCVFFIDYSRDPTKGPLEIRPPPSSSLNEEEDETDVGVTTICRELYNDWHEADHKIAEIIKRRPNEDFVVWALDGDFFIILSACIEAQRQLQKPPPPPPYRIAQQQPRQQHLVGIDHPNRGYASALYPSSLSISSSSSSSSLPFTERHIVFHCTSNQGDAKDLLISVNEMVSMFTNTQVTATSLMWQAMLTKSDYQKKCNFLPGIGPEFILFEVRRIAVAPELKDRFDHVEQERDSSFYKACLENITRGALDRKSNGNGTTTTSNKRRVSAKSKKKLGDAEAKRRAELPIDYDTEFTKFKEAIINWKRASGLLSTPKPKPIVSLAKTFPFLVSSSTTTTTTPVATIVPASSSSSNNNNPLVKRRICST